MEYGIIFLIIYSIAITIAEITKRKIEITIPVATVSIIIMIYVAGLFNHLEIGMYVVEIISVLSIGYVVYKIIKSIKEKTIKQFIGRTVTPGVVIYIVLYGINIVINQGRILENYDEFNHWAVITKNMFVYNQFGTVENSVVTFNEYPPFTAIFQYFFLQIKNSYSEDSIIIAQNMLYLSFIISIFENIRWDKSLKKTIALVPIIIFLPMIFYKNFYLEILVDGFLGILFGLGLYQVYRQDVESKYLLLVTCMIALILTKTTGIALAIILIVAEMIKIIRSKNDNKKKTITKVGIIFLSMLLIYGTWQIKINYENANTNWQMEKIYLQNEKREEEKENIINQFFRGIFLSKKVLTEKEIGTMVCLLLLITFMICLDSKIQEKKEKQQVRYSNLVMVVSIVLYMTGMLWMYLTIFNSEEAGILASYDRYIGTILLAAFLLNSRIAFEKFEVTIKSILIVASIGMIFIPFKTIEERYIDGENYKKVASVQRKKYNDIVQYKDKMTKNDKIYYLSNTGADTRYSIKIARYEMMPILVGNSDATKFGKLEEWKKTLQKENYTYVYLYEIDTAFKEKYKSIFENEQVEAKTMYKVKQIEEQIVLEKIKI